MLNSQTNINQSKCLINSYKKFLRIFIKFPISLFLFNYMKY